MINLAIALAFIVSFFFSPGGRILQLAIEQPVMQSLPRYQAHLLLAFANYWVPALLIYVILQITRANIWLRSRGYIQVLLGSANTLFVLYIGARIFASTVEGGGASFVVVSYAPFVLWPAMAMVVGGLVWLTIRSIRLREVPPPLTAAPPGRWTALAVATAIFVPGLALAFPLFLLPDAPFRLAKEAQAILHEQCSRAGETIFRVPTDVQAVYLEPDGAARFEKIVDDHYGAQGSGILGEPLVNAGFLQYFERKNERGPSKYTRHARGDWRGEPVDEISSIYGVFQESLVPGEVEKRLQLHGKRVTVKNLKTDEVIGTLTYFVSRRDRSICGHSGERSLDVGAFVRRALGLRKPADVQQGVPADAAAPRG